MPAAVLCRSEWQNAEFWRGSPNFCRTSSKGLFCDGAAFPGHASGEAARLNFKPWHRDCRIKRSILAGGENGPFRKGGRRRIAVMRERGKTGWTELGPSGFDFLLNCEKNKNF